MSSDSDSDVFFDAEESDSDSDVFFDAEDSIPVRVKPINTDEKADEKEEISTSEFSLKENVLKLPQLDADKDYLLDEEFMEPLLDFAVYLQETYHKTKDNEQCCRIVEEFKKKMFNNDHEILEIHSEQSSIASSSVVVPKSNSNYVLKYSEANDTSSVISLKVGSILGERDSVLSKDADAVSIDSKYSIETESVQEVNDSPLPNSQGCEPDVVASTKTDQAQYPVAPPRTKKKKNLQSCSGEDKSSNSQLPSPDPVESLTRELEYSLDLQSATQGQYVVKPREAYRKAKDKEQRHRKVEELRKQMFNDDDELLEIHSEQSSIASSPVEGFNPKSNSNYVLNSSERNDTSSVISLGKAGSIVGEKDSVLSKDADAVSIDSKYSIEAESVRELNVPPLPNSQRCDPDVVDSNKTDQAQYPVAPRRRKKKKHHQSTSVQTEKTKDGDLDTKSHSKPSDKKTDTSHSAEKDPDSKTACTSDESKKKINYLYQSIVKPFDDKSGNYTSQTTLVNTKKYGYSSSSAGGLSGSDGSGLYLVGGYRKSSSRDNGQMNIGGYNNAIGRYYSTGFLGEFSASNPGRYTTDNIGTYSVCNSRQFGEMNSGRPIGNLYGDYNTIGVGSRMYLTEPGGNIFGGSVTGMANINEMNIPGYRRNMIGGYSAVPVGSTGSIGGRNIARAGGNILGEYSTGMTRGVGCLGLAGPCGNLLGEYSTGMTGGVGGLGRLGPGGNIVGEYSAGLPGNIGLNSASPSRNVFGGYNSGMSRDFGGMDTAGSDRNNLGGYNSSMLSGFGGMNTVGSDRNSLRECNPGMARDFGGMNPVGSDRNSLREYHSGMTRGFGGMNLVGSGGNILREYGTRVSESLGNLVGTSSPRYGGNMFRNHNPGQTRGINRVTHDYDWNRFGEYRSFIPENNNVMGKSDENMVTGYNPTIMRGMDERDFAKSGKDKLE